MKGGNGGFLGLKVLDNPAKIFEITKSVLPPFKVRKPENNLQKPENDRNFIIRKQKAYLLTFHSASFFLFHFFSLLLSLQYFLFDPIFFSFSKK
jgi:hypothetical protein